jgi:hypothetical protein
MKRVCIWFLCALGLQGCADSTGSSANTAPAALTYYGGAPNDTGGHGRGGGR